MITWPLCRAGEAIDLLARHCGHSTGTGELPAPPLHVTDGGPKAFSEWVEAAALRLGLDPNDLKLMTAAFVFAALILPNLLKAVQRKNPGHDHA